jgi:hypothetical protein
LNLILFIDIDKNPWIKPFSNFGEQPYVSGGPKFSEYKATT